MSSLSSLSNHASHLLAPHLLASTIPTFPPRTIGPLTFTWAQPAGRLIWSSLLLIVIIVAAVIVAKRPKPAEPATWAQCMLGSVFVFGAMLLAYGVVPHEWLTFSNSYLKWNESKFLVRSGQKIGPIHFLNFDINKRSLSDTGAVIIYVVVLSVNIYLFSLWQKRPVRSTTDTSAKAATEEKVVGESAYGRPVVARG